jgi:ABC-type bacteriocin/lantibiotic exporter with double-glycine peptidase domain
MNVITKILHKVEKDLMYWQKADSKGVKHNLCKQQKDMSCGIACIAMIVHRVHGVRLRESQLRSYSKIFNQGPGTNTEGYNKKDGTDAKNCFITLEKLGVKCEYLLGVQIPASLTTATTKTPIMALIDWKSEDQAGGGGSHFVIVDSYDAGTGMAVICDPWYGLVEYDVRNGEYSPGGGVLGKFPGRLIVCK